jgi:hypothetical protein
VTGFRSLQAVLLCVTIVACDDTLGPDVTNAFLCSQTGTQHRDAIASGTWRAQNGPHWLMNMVSVDSLKIEPGTLVCAMPNTSLATRVLIARGTEAQPIRFLAGDSTSAWLRARPFGAARVRYPTRWPIRPGRRMAQSSFSTEVLDRSCCAGYRRGMKRPQLIPALAVIILACSTQHATNPVPPPRIIPHAEWQAEPPLGYAADATRRNIGAGGSLDFRDFTIDVLSTAVDATGTAPGDVVRLRLSLEGATEERVAREGSAFNWRGYHVAVVAIYGPKELGSGLVALEVATVASLPPHIAAATTAGGADMRLRIPHGISHVTLHHSGDAQPLRPGDDPVQRLRGLQSWGARDRNWWDVPYHFLMDLNGRIYEGRDYHYMGETNTSYDPGGHFLISIIGITSGRSRLRHRSKRLQI